jgi:hypothetical protein
MKLKLTLIKAIGVAVLTLGSSQVHANLIVNGGFEAGLTGWATSPFATTTLADVHSGSLAADLGPSVGGLFQTITPALTIGQTYVLSFWAKDSGNIANTSQTLSITVFNGLTKSFDTTSTYALYNYGFTYTGGPSLIAFGWSDGNEHAFIDDINLVPVPEPTTMIAGALLLLPFGASAVRILRKNHVASV